MSRKPASVWEKALREAAKELDLPKDNFAVERYATLSLLLRYQRSEWAQGKLSNPGDMIEVMDAIAALRKSAHLDAPRKIEVSFVQGVEGIYKCQHCGKQNELPDGSYTPVKRRESRPQSTPAEKATGEALKPEEPPSAADITPPPPMPVIEPSPTMQAWNRRMGYGRSNRDGRLIKGMAAANVSPMSYDGTADPIQHRPFNK